VLRPGEEKLAAIQFTTLSSPLREEEVQSRGFAHIHEQHLSDETALAGGLVFFRNVSILQDKVEEVRQGQALIERRLHGVEAGSNQVVMFGVYLVCLALIGLSLQTILGMVTNERTMALIVQADVFIRERWIGVVASLAAVLAAAWAMYSGIRAVANYFRRRWQQRVVRDKGVLLKGDS
jgi:hypothetical protein